ncbi:capping protein-inhibiting regulator of actin dynamics [Chaetodon trifascialis]|uniref:capping protein-inhibiting regulator of actin dynamics n=1 Tax=Chaetodon trifascialis TaxID=109706 RepID=UPI003990E2F4
MAAQVEVQTGEVGRTVGGGRLHLSPLTDSSNSLMEIPPIGQPHIISPEPNKPVPGPKPRLTPKPFAVERNPTIKPILAPKPQTKPRPESTRLAGYKPEPPCSPKPQQLAAPGKAGPVSSNPNRPASTSFKTSQLLTSGQTTKPVVQPFKPAPSFDPGDPSKPVPVERQKPGAPSLSHSKSLKKPSAAEWSGSTKRDGETEQLTPGKGGPSITRAKSMGFLIQVGQEEEDKAEAEAAVPLRPQPRCSRPRPVSAIFPDSPAKTEKPVPAPRWAGRRPLSADLTSKFESIGLSLHRKSPSVNVKEDVRETTAPKSPSPQRTEGAAKPAVSDQSNRKTEELTATEKDTEEDKRALSTRSRIGVLHDSSSSPGTGATGQDLHPPVQPVPESEPPVGVKKLIKQLTEDTPPTQSPVPKPPVKPRPLPLDLTKRFSSEKSPDHGGVWLGDAADRHDVSRDPQRRIEDSPFTPSEQRTFVELKDSQEQLKKASTPEGPEAGQTFGAAYKDSGPGGDVQTVRASLFENVVERRSVLMVDEGKPVNKARDSLSSPSLQRGSSEDEGTLVTATYREPVSPSSPLRVLHAFDTVQAVEESRAVSENIPAAQWEDKAMTLRSRRSEGGRPAAERTGPAQGEPAPAAMPDQPRYLRVGALHKWNNTGFEQEAGTTKVTPKDSPWEDVTASDKNRDRPREAEQEEVAAAPKRLKMLQAEEQPKPRATYFALTGQIQEALSPAEAGAAAFDEFSVRPAPGGVQRKIPPVQRNPSLNEMFGKTSLDQVEESLMRSHASHGEIRSALDGQMAEETMEVEKKRELKKESERQRAKMKEQEREKQRQLDMEKEAYFEFERMKEREMQREYERQRQKAFEKERQEFEEKQRALERQKQVELEKLERERQRQLEKDKRRELERQRKLEREKVQEQERERQREQERQRQREEERQRELDKERQLLEIQKEKQRMEELQRAKELERQQLVELQKQKEKERQQLAELERHRLREKKEKEEAEKMKQMALEQEMLRMRELEKERERQREVEREKQKELERQRQRDLERERQRQLDIERQELENQRLRQREQEKERQRKEEVERIKEMERRQLVEFEKQKQAERDRQQVLEQERRRLRDKMQREEAEVMMRHAAKQQEAERQQLREKQKKEEQERARLEPAPLRPKVLDLDSVVRSEPVSKAPSLRRDPSTRWKEPSLRAEDSYKPSILDIDAFTSQLPPSKDLFPVPGVQGGDAGVGARLQPTPERDVSWKVPPPAGGFSSPVWTMSPQDPWELRPVEMSVDKPSADLRKQASKPNPELLLLRQEERLLTPQRSWSAGLDELLYVGPFPGTEAKTRSSAGEVSGSAAAEQIWIPRETQPQDSRGDVQSHRRSQGSQDLNRMRSRSVSRRSAPASSAVEGNLSRMRSRSAHREQQCSSWVQQSNSAEEEGRDLGTPVRDTDSQYGTWETGLRTEDSLTPATPSSESNLSPSPRKPTPPHTPGDLSSQFDSDTVDSLPPSSSLESQTLSFPDAPAALLDTSALRSRVQLGKKRAPRTRPSRAARQSTLLEEGRTGEDWLYRDSTEAKAESKDEDSDSEQQTRAAESVPAVAAQPQRVALFPGMDPSALKAQLKKRGDSDVQTDGPAPSPSQLSRSPKSPFLPRAARVLPPAGGKENGEEDSPQWLKELKSKKRLSQYENES